MSLDRNFSSSQDPDASSQLCADVKTETSGRGMELHVKQEETLESNGDDFDNTPEVISIKKEEADSEFYLYCEFCKSHFFNKCEVHGPALFIPDTPVPLGVTDRARQTLPPGLEIRNSSIPDAGLGVFNNGEIVPVGAHFGPYQGELVDREDAMNSRYSWVISRRGQCEKYVDAKREMHANWMRYVNCARNKGEQNLMAFMYQGGILYRCCRAVDPGEELLVWYEEEYAKDLGHTFDCLWSNKYFANDFSGGLEGEEASLLAAEQVQFDTVCHGGSEEDLDAENLCLDAEEDAPPRKRLRAENTWKKVINKKRRMVGKAYTGKQKQKEIMREPRAIGPRCSSAACAKSAKHHCSAISEPERNSIFNYFWQHMTWEEKRMYVHGLIDVVPVQRRRGAENSRRSNSLMFFLRVSGQRRRVCKSMFLSTLGIGEWSAVNWAKEGYTQADTEGQTHSNARRSVAGHEFIRSFLQDLPKVPSHYCRSSTSKQYLEPVFQSMADLYAVYCRVAAEKNVTPLSRQVFADEFKRLNLDIYHRKKDQCNICCAFKTGNLPDDELQHHLLQKEEACTEKLSDKCKASNKIMVICMDLQALLLCPKLKAPELYYKTKLAVHNFTVYNMLTHSATCYVWHEGEGSLSASEFASCIVDYLSAHTEPDTFILWSDGCGYQTRNAVLSNALLLFSMKKNKVVIQKYLEKGHSQMECDSVHSVIERRLRDQDVYLPAEYVNLMKRARVKPHPYEVKYIDHTFFQDFTKLSLCKSLHPGVRPGDLTVHDIRAIRYNNNGTMDLKINHSDDWRPHPSQELRNSTSDSQTVTPLYSDSLKITELKFKHLQDLKEVIPKDFHSFYDNLLH